MGRWVHELLFYDRGKHAGDVLMSGWIAFASAKAYAAIRPQRQAEIRIISEHGDEMQIARDREARRAAREAEERRVAAFPPGADGLRRPASNPNVAVRDVEPDAERFPGSELHRAFDVGTAEPAVDEWTARERRRNGYRGDEESIRSAVKSAIRLANGTIGNDPANDVDASESGSWKRGGYRGGGVL